MHKMYVLVRTDLPRAVQTVQACHAAAECALHYKGEWDNGTMIVLGVPDHHTLMGWHSQLKRTDLNVSLFQETDMPDLPETALALVVHETMSSIFKELKLLK